MTQENVLKMLAGASNVARKSAEAIKSSGGYEITERN